MSDLTLDECKIKLGEVDAKCGDDGMQTKHDFV